LTNNIDLVNSPLLSILTSFVESMPELQGAVEPTELWSLSNGVVFNSNGINPFEGPENGTYGKGYLEWSQDWSAFFYWDFKGTAEWNVSDIVDPLTKETTHLRVNPDPYTYLFFDAGFTWGTENIGFKFDAYFQPIAVHLLEVDLWKSVNYPEWWTSKDNE